jgi:Fur family transcriptional regulator, ferric uptake regulator
MTHITAANTEDAGFGPARLARSRDSGDGPQRTLNTPRKRALLEVLEGADRFLSTAELHGRLCAHLAPQGLRMGIATVYSQLRRLAQSGAVDTLRSDEGETLYWLPRRDEHHHYLVCRSCGRAVEVEADPVEEWADALGATVGFREVTHTFELFGLCHRCADPGAMRNRQRRVGPTSSPTEQSARSSIVEDD